MKIAYCINNNGEKIEVKATDGILKKYMGKLFCPYCGEKVDPYINGKKQQDHFRHHHSSFSQECENYCNSISSEKIFHPYEREGLQLYLIKELGRFYLYLGLYGLEEKTIKDAENINLEIHVDMGMDYSKKVDSKDFIPRTLEFIRLDVIKQKYNLRFTPNNVPTEIRTKWLTYINGIGPNGAIFNFGENGGKKVSSSVGVKVNQKYILLTKSNMEKQYINGLLCKFIEELSMGWLENYKIYKIIIKELNQETLLFCDRFDLKLSYLKPEIVPIWPPCISIEQELIYQYDGNKYFTVECDDDNSKNTYSYSLQKRINSEVINNKKNIVKACLRGNDFLSLGSLKNQFMYSIIRKDLNNIDIKPDVKVNFTSRKLIIEPKVKVIINSYKNQLLTKSKVIKEESMIEFEYKRNEKLELLYGMDIIWEANEEKQEEIKSDMNFLDQKLLSEIYMCRGKTMDIPNNFKWMVLKRKKYSKSFRTLQRVLMGKKVYIELVKLLEKH